MEMNATTRKNNGMMTVGQAALSVGVPATTLRFYEREGILAATVRNGAGYRLYDAQAVERLHFIRAAQAVGFTLDDIRALLEIDGKNTCRKVRRLLERRLADVDAKLLDLRCVRATLADSLDRCRRSMKGCAVVADLKTAHKKRRCS